MTSGWVDLRSDTVTQPTPEMRRAMGDAEVGDDVYGEDPTVNALEEAFAERVGKQASLFVPSGTMGNQLALRLLAPGGTTVIAGRRQHVVVYENGAAGLNAGVQFHTVDDAGGTVAAADVAWAVDAASHHYPTPSLLCLENTHMPANGAPWPVDRLVEVTDLARRMGLRVHLDGARLFNAATATATPVAVLSRGATTVMCCLSKGLCAPVGSLLAGDAEDMARARADRQRLGGGMRQAGVIAAAGLVALATMVERLADDHRRALRLAEVVAERWPEGGLSPADVRTNCVTFAHPHPERLLDHLRAEGVLAGTIAPGIVRLMTHHDVADDGLVRATNALATAH